MKSSFDRRRWLACAGSAVIGAAAAGSASPAAESKDTKDEGDTEVPAVEDLMREHGILRRALLVYSEAASRLHHAAIEDTIIFPAWKRAITAAQYKDLTEEFENLEHKMFGKDGFEDALEKIASIEQSFGLGDLSTLTAPPPPGRA